VSSSCPRTPPVGEYRFQLHHIRAAQRYTSFASNSVRVAAFGKPEFEVEVTAERRDYVDGDTVDATVTASFFGGALEGVSVEWAAVRSPIAP
jgi:uncharacterized protein YfaS (alpha-2-macroglobulin family)